MHAGQSGRGAVRTSRIRAGLLAGAAFVAVPALVGSNTAWAACTPPPGDNVTATCSGTTTGGYGTGVENNLTVNVLSGATVANPGATAISLASGTVTNAGTISGVFGIIAFNAPGNLNVVNLAGGTIQTDDRSIYANNVLNLTNYGSIVGAGNFVITGGQALGAGPSQIANYGEIKGLSFVINITSAATSITNFGTITATSGNGAIVFNQDNNTLTIGPGSVINGSVFGFGGLQNNTFQLGGSGVGSFDASLIGTQYTSFATFNKIRRVLFRAARFADRFTSQCDRNCHAERHSARDTGRGCLSRQAAIYNPNKRRPHWRFCAHSQHSKFLCKCFQFRQRRGAKSRCRDARPIESASR
jgi:hypothetical protein